MLDEQFIDENVIILKKDGTDNEFFALSNENTIPDYNIPKYLNSLKCKEFGIKEIRLLNGNTLQIYNPDIYNFPIEQIDNKYNSISILDGNYLSNDKRLMFHIQNGRIRNITRNVIMNFKDGESYEIENGNIRYLDDYCTLQIYNNINKKVTINGNPISDTRLIDKRNFIYKIKESKIAGIFVNFEYELKDGSKIIVEQKDYSKINKGDKIIASTPLFPLPDGSYKIKGKWSKIKVSNCIIQ